MPIRRFRKPRPKNKGRPKRSYGKGRFRRTYTRRPTYAVSKAIVPGIWKGITTYEYYSRWGTAGLQLHRFRLNSLFDPDHTGLGYSATRHDQIGYIYENYTVFGAKTLVIMQNMKNNQMIRFSYWANEDSDAPTTIEDAMTMNGAKAGMIGPLGSSKDKVAIKHYASVKKVCKVKDVRDSTQLANIHIGANPGEVLWGTLYMSNDDVVNEKDVAVRIRIYFYCAYTDPAEVGTY